VWEEVLVSGMCDGSISDTVAQTPQVQSAGRAGAAASYSWQISFTSVIQRAIAISMIE